MAATYMLRKHIRAAEAAEKPAAVEDRRICMEASKRANEARLKQFKILTPENFEEANEFYKKRFARWKRILSN